MWRLSVCLLVFLSGCSTDKSQWDGFWKDLRGDNMKMRGDFDAQIKAP